MSEFNVQFVNNHRRRRELVPCCPACGQENKRGNFAPMVDQYGELIILNDKPAGECYSCGFRNCSSESGSIDFQPRKQSSRKPKQIAYIPFDYIDESQNHPSGLHSYASIHFPSVFEKIFSKYYVGGTEKGETVYWQINKLHLVCRCMIKHQDPETGKGSTPRYEQKSILSKLGRHGESPYCAFGEHLLADNQKDAIVVESQKTALLMACYDAKNPPKNERIWIATCGSSNLKKLIESNVLEGRKVMLIPDGNMTGKWANIVTEHGKTWAVFVGLKEKLGEKNIDLADLL